MLYFTISWPLTFVHSSPMFTFSPNIPTANWLKNIFPWPSLRRCGAQFGTILVSPGSQSTCTKVCRIGRGAQIGSNWFSWLESGPASSHIKYQGLLSYEYNFHLQSIFIELNSCKSMTICLSDTIAHWDRPLQHNKSATSVTTACWEVTCPTPVVTARTERRSGWSRRLNVRRVTEASTATELDSAQSLACVREVRE